MEENVWRCCSAPSVFHHSAATCRHKRTQKFSPSSNHLLSLPFELQSRAATGGVMSSSYITSMFVSHPERFFYHGADTSLNFRLHILKTSENGYEEAANDVDPLKLLDLIHRGHFSLFYLPNSYFFRTSPEVAECLR